jgi:hypothetical protein
MSQELRGMMRAYIRCHLEERQDDLKEMTKEMNV